MNAELQIMMPLDALLVSWSLSSFAVGVVQVRASQGRRGRDTGSYVDRGERREVRAWAARTVKRLWLRDTRCKRSHGGRVGGLWTRPGRYWRDIMATSKGRLWWRRLYAAPMGGPLAGGDPLRHRFDRFLKKLIILRDRRCRDPFCDAPIRHIDHVQRYTEGGLTIYPNGRGECERGNYAREMPGWTVEAVCSGLDGNQHAITIATPTGHTYLPLTEASISGWYVPASPGTIVGNED